MLKYILLALLIIIIISIAYWLFFYNTDERRRKNSEKLIQGSGGTFDKNAQLALAELNRITNPTPNDYFRRGHIIQYNILEGNIRGRRRALNNIIRDYTDAIIDMHVDIEQDNNPFIIDHIVNFNHFLRELENDDILATVIFDFNDVINSRAPALRKEIINERRKQAISSSRNRAEAINKYFDSAVKFTNDNQNVHDNKVNSDLRETLEKLKSTAPADFNPKISIAEATNFVLSEYDEPDKIEKAMMILDIINNGELISTYGEREDRIFGYVWERCKHPKNESNKKLMKEAVINALIDSVENDIPVCINGRCARVLNSLVTLDYDAGIGAAMTFEAYKNQIYQETKDIINKEITRAKNSQDPELKAVGEAYETGSESQYEAAEKKFRADIKAEIDLNLNKYINKLSEDELKNIKQECYVYATL